MLKNKFKIITLLLVIILSMTIPIVRADHDTNISVENSDNMDINPISDDPTTSEDNFKKSDVYLSGDNVTIDYIVDGNLFVAADTVTINSQIGGDAFIFANKVIIEDQGYIFSNLFTTCQYVEIKGVVYDVYALSKDVSIADGYIYRDLKVLCDTLNITGTVGRNVFASCANILFNNEQDDNSSTGVISGNLNYSSKDEITIPEGAVSGETNFTKEIVNTQDNIQDYLIEIGTFIATALIIWLLCLWITPKFLNNTNILITKKILPVIGIGLLTPIVAIIASIILFILGITSSIGFLTLGLLFILLGISNSIFIIAINNLVCNKLKVEKTIGIFGMLIASSVVLWLIELIPYIGGLVKFISVIIGLGMLIYSIPVKFKKEKVEEE